MQRSGLTLGIFGGTFDPFHLGHLALARAAVAELALDRLLVIPARTPPHRDAAAATAEQRLEMVRVALAGEAGMRADDREVQRGGPSYTVDTVHDVCGSEGVTRPWLILGADAAASLPTWHAWEVLVRSVRFAVAGRAGDDALPDRPGALAGSGAHWQLLDARLPEISSTTVRARLAAGAAIDDLVPAPVAAYIHEQGLYRVERPGGPGGQTAS